MFCRLIQGGAAFVDHFVSKVSYLVFIMLSCLFLVVLWSPAGKEMTSLLSFVLCIVTFPDVYWLTSELRVRMVPLNMLKPSSIFTDQSKAVLLLWITFVICVSCWLLLYFLFIYCKLVITCWERADLLTHCVWCFLVFWSLFLMVSQVSCGTW